MEEEPKFEADISAKEKYDVVSELEKAITATNRSIAEHRANNGDTSELETHLESLKERLEAVKGM